MIERGVCKRWISSRTFGFISAAEGSDDVFCHITACPEHVALVEGQQVSFERVTGPDGRFRAVNVRLIESAPDTPWWGRGELL